MRFRSWWPVVLSFILFSCATAVAEAGWFENDLSWRDRTELFFDNSASGETLVDFPVLVHLTGANFDFSRAQSGGQDVRFTQDDGTTQLAHEIEHWNQAGQEAWIWVNVPSIAAGSTSDKIYMYSANPTALNDQDVEGTWNADFRMVHHLQETSGMHMDSTSYDHDATWVAPTRPGNPATQDGIGQIGGANKFWGIASHPPDPATEDKTHAYVPFTPELQDMYDLTLEAWVNPGELHSSEAHIVRNNGAYMFDVNTEGRVRFRRVDSDWSKIVQASTNLSVDEWSHLVGTADYDANLDETVLRIYFNGVLEQERILSGKIEYGGTFPLRIGARSDAYGDNFFHGNIDEVRLASAAYSADWVEAQYLSMTDAFIGFGAVYSVPEPGSLVLLLLGVAGLMGCRPKCHRSGSA